MLLSWALIAGAICAGVIWVANSDDGGRSSRPRSAAGAAASPTPSASPIPVGALAVDGCQGWDAWATDLTPVLGDADRLIATAGDHPSPSSADYYGWAARLAAIARDVERSDPPPAAVEYARSLAGYYNELAAYFQAAAEGRDTPAAWDGVQRLRGETQRLREDAIGVCLYGWDPPTPTPTPPPTSTPMPTRTPTAAPTAGPGADCTDLDGWVDRMEELAPRVDDTLATVEADVVPSPTQFRQWAAELQVLADELLGTAPPPAARPYVEALAGYLLALREALLAEADGRYAERYYDEADRHRDEAERLLARANRECAE